METLCDLPYDMLLEIAKHLKKLEDFTCFRSVSKSLRVVVKDEYFEGLRLRQQTPYLMLPVRDDKDDNIREFYSLVEGESTVASVEVARFKTKKCFESLGWLLTVEVDGSMSLLDPFSGTEIPLPHQTTFPEYESELMDEHFFIQKMALSSRPSETCDFVVMVIAGGCGHLAFWRLGDKAWNRITTQDGRCLDVVCDGNEQFYTISCLGVVRFINFARNVKHVECRLIARCGKLAPRLDGTENVYIMKTVGGSVHIITRASPNMSEDGLSYITSKFQVYEVDIATGAWKEIYSLGSMAVFLGENSTIALDAARFPNGAIKANHIYFTDGNWEFYYFEESAKGFGMDIGVYSLETRTVEPIYLGEPLFSKVSPPTWITPCF